MSRLRLSRADRLLLCVVLILAALGGLLAWLAMPPEKTGGFFRVPSTLFNTGYGAKAAYLALQELEFPVERLRRPIDETTLDGIGVLFLLASPDCLMEDEAAALDEWIQDGHALVVVPGGPDGFMASCASCRGGTCARDGENPLHEWFALENTAEKPDGKKSADDGWDEFRPIATVRVNLQSKEPTPGWQPDRSEPLTAGVGPLSAGDSWRFKPAAPLGGGLKSAPVNILWKDRLGTVALRVGYGDGTIVALADPYPLTNIGLGEGDNGLLLANVARCLSEQYPGEMAFDEYHLGFPHREWSPLAIAKLTFAERWGWAMAQATLVGALILYAGVIRFGSPRDVVLRKRRQRREYAEAAGRLLSDARATALAAETLRRHYRERLCRLVRLEAAADDRRLGLAVAERLGYDILPVLQQAAGAAARPVGRQKLLAIFQQLHQAAEALDHGT